jgi:beta-carotene 3-hydroxylase
VTAHAVLVAVVFLAMEPLTALVHRLVMHGPGFVLHRSHHRRRRGRLEANDWFPVVFAAVVMAGMAAGFNVDGLAPLVPVGAGVTLYGLAYATVHDVCIHQRLGPVSAPPVVRRLAAAHAVHHRSGGAPYGMLAPVVPGSLRRAVWAPVAPVAPATAAAGDQPG